MDKRGGAGMRANGLVRVLGAIAGVSMLAALAAGPALAGPGLPRTYSVQRVDSPEPRPSRNFGFIFVNAGDLNGDGEEDLLVPQGTALLADGNGAENGEVVVVSGADGSTIRRIQAPEPESGTDPADRRPAFGTYVGKIGFNGGPPFTDIGSCPAGDPSGDRICDPPMGGPDGVPDILASAPFANVPTAGPDGGRDMGRVYVIDGASGLVLKRIDMPAADREDQDPRTERLGGRTPATPVRPLFGRTVLAPAGLPPCEGNAGVGTCPPTSAVPNPVRIGDLDGGGRPDIVIGASFVQDDDGTNPSCNDTADPDVCDRSGRTYMYRGEEITGSDPGAVESTPDWRMLNPYAQADDPSSTFINDLELWGHSVAPVGDVGKCNVTPATPGNACPQSEINHAPDGKPEVLVADFRVDYPLNEPTPEWHDVGVNVLLDGATGARLHTYTHPEPQPSTIFGFSLVNQPAMGDLGRTALPDLFLPATGQNDRFRGQGRGYVVNGFRASPNDITMAMLNDPTPHASGNFGTSSAGVGDVVGAPVNEVLVGAFASHNPPQNQDVISDAHIFDARTEQALQTIPDPDQQAVSQFGTAVAPMGDLNGDGFLDLAVGAGRHDLTPTQLDTGRVYLFRSDNSPPPQPPPAAQPTAPRTLLPGRCANVHRGTNRSETINGTVAGDNILGFGGNDRLNGLDADDCLDGGSGRDRLVGGSGADRLVGGSGSDRLSGGSGRNSYSGGSGNDRISAANRRRERISCGRGRDSVTADRSDRVSGCERVRRRRR